jgi:S1-C subfamily serine protease
MKLRSLVLGLVGGVVGAIAVFLLLVLVFDVGKVKKETIIQTQTVTPTTYATPGRGLSPEEIYRRDAPGVVMILAQYPAVDQNLPFGFGTPQPTETLGTGFVVSGDGYILTNAHVVSNTDPTTTTATVAKTIAVVFKTASSNTQRVSGRLVGIDQESDVAVVKVDPSGLTLHPLPLGDSSRILVGEPVVAIGNPLNYDFTLTAGIVSAVGRDLMSPSGATITNGIQTDAAINQGNSGGPLIDAQGNVIGINEQIASQSGGNEGLGFAVPVNTAKRSLDQLRKYGKVTYAWLGVVGQTLTPDVAHMFNFKATSGVLIIRVVANGPAAKAGIKGGTDQVTIQGQQYTIGGDILTAIDGKSLASNDELRSIVSAKRPGEIVTVTVLRAGKTIQVKVTLEQRPSGS